MLVLINFRHSQNLDRVRVEKVVTIVESEIVHSFQLEHIKKSLSRLQITWQTNLTLLCGSESTGIIIHNWGSVYIIYMAYLFIHVISFNSACLCRPQGGEGLPLLALFDTSKCNLLQLFLHVFYGLASVYNLHQARGKKKKKQENKNQLRFSIMQ